MRPHPRNVFPLHRAVQPVDYDRRPQVEEQRLYSARDMGFAFFLGGLFFSLIFAAVAWLLAGMPS